MGRPPVSALPERSTIPEELRLAIGVHKLARMLSRIEVFEDQWKELDVCRQHCNPNEILEILTIQADDGTMTQVECHCNW